MRKFKHQPQTHWLKISTSRLRKLPQLTGRIGILIETRYHVQNFSCASKNVINVITYSCCGQTYIGRTSMGVSRRTTLNNE